MKVLLGTIVCLFFLGCSTSREENDREYYLRNSLLPGYSRDKLDIGNFHSYRFLEKYRVSHRWLSGADVFPCLYPLNIYRRLGGYGSLMDDRDGPYYESNGYLSFTNQYGNGPIVVDNMNLEVLGEESGVFKQYRPYCSYFNSDAAVGMALYLIKPDERKGVDEFVSGSTEVQTSGLRWLRKQISPYDEKYRNRPNAVPVEYWVLEIPQTPYWIVLKFTINPNTTVQQHFDQYVYMRSLFYGIVESVKLEPISPMEYKPVE